MFLNENVFIWETWAAAEVIHCFLYCLMISLCVFYFIALLKLRITESYVLDLNDPKMYHKTQ